eukprot:jgi/Astpho2/5023/Aster-x0658
MSRLRALSTCNTRYKMVYTPLFLMAPAVAQAAWQAESETLEVIGTEHVSIYRDPRYAQSIYPVAGAIDTKLAPPPERNHIMLDSKPTWVLVPEGPTEHHYDTLPPESIADWHKNHGW